jgi:hypothetical protein
MAVPYGSKKGQMFTAELVIGSAMMVGALVFFVLLWQLMQASYINEEKEFEMKNALVSISEGLVSSPGDPTGWQYDYLENSSMFGLAESPNSLSESKLSALQSLNATHYNLVKERMGAGKFEIYIWLKQNSTSNIPIFGLQPNVSDQGISSATITRQAIRQGSLYSLGVQLWYRRS